MRGLLAPPKRERTRHPLTEAATREAELIDQIAALRLRTAMELHDGILQTLAGVSLQIAVARRLVRESPEAAESVLARLGETISAEQQEMRLFVDELKGQDPSSTGPRVRLPDAVASMLDHVRAIWGLDVSCEVEFADELPPETSRDVVRVIQEATVNAARHGSARTISVHVDRDGSEIAIRIADNGHGFPFLGDLDMKALRERRLGPLSLKHRVEACGGRLAIRSTRQGATISIWLPVPSEPGS